CSWTSLWRAGPFFVAACGTGGSKYPSENAVQRSIRHAAFAQACKKPQCSQHWAAYSERAGYERQGACRTAGTPHGEKRISPTAARRRGRAARDNNPATISSPRAAALRTQERIERSGCDQRHSAVQIEPKERRQCVRPV